MGFLVMYLTAMTVPGALLSRMVGLKFHRFGFSIALSFSVFVLCLALARAMGLGATGFGWLAIACYAAIAAVFLWWIRGEGASLFGGISFDRVYLIPIAVVAAVACYSLWAGPYTEVPSDAWWHIGRINGRLSDLQHGSIGSAYGLADLVSKAAGYWYTTAAYFLDVTGTGLRSGMGYLAFANKLLFSVGVYSFALFVFEKMVDSRAMRHAVAAATVFFFFTHFGLSVFSYVRYYVYAPTMLNYVVYLTVLACVVKFLDNASLDFRLPVVGAVLSLVAAVVHKQEGMFILVMSGAILLVEFVRVWRERREAVSVERGARMRICVLFTVFALAYGTFHVASYVLLVRHNPLNYGLMADIQNYLPFLRNLYVLKPTYQFYEVITVWGVLVYVMFFFYRREFKGAPYLVAGMLLPVLTIFNPVYTDLFLRFAWPEVLWRICYALPLPFVGGYLLIRELRAGFQEPGPARKAKALILSAALLALLLPAQTTYFVSTYSKIYTLAPVGPENDYRLWNDLLVFLDSQVARGVVTDPVTGYVINGLTKKRYSGYKFYGLGAIPLNKDSYDAAMFDYRKGWLLVVNRRDGAASDTGRYGRHWRAHIMAVSELYSTAFLDFIRNNPDMFRKIWSRDRITVYRIDGA